MSTTVFCADPGNNRYAPPSMRAGYLDGPLYVISEQRLREIRSEFLYWFYDRGGDDGYGDYQKDIHASSPQIHKNFNFQLPFFGFRFNYTRVSSMLFPAFSLSLIDLFYIHELPTGALSDLYLGYILQ